MDPLAVFLVAYIIFMWRLCVGRGLLMSSHTARILERNSFRRCTFEKIRGTHKTKALVAALAIAATTLAFGGFANATSFPGPDGAGYTGSSIANNLRDISSSGTFVSLGDDSVSAANAIGFPFTFYGNTYNSAYISSNGFLTFNGGSSSGCCGGGILPSAGNPSNLVAGLWTDLNNPQGNIRYQTLGSPGSQEFVVGFYGVPFYLGGALNTFEMILHEGSNNIELQYGALGLDSHIVSSGIENSPGTIGLEIFRGTANSTMQQALQNQGFLITQPIGETPIPTALPLFASGLGALGLLGWRRKRKNAAARAAA